MRGNAKAEVLLCGEGPGQSEDVHAVPFIGPAGKLLDTLINQAVIEAGYLPKLAWTNLVACIPKGEDNRKKGEPNANEIKACQPRLEEFIRLCRPKYLIAVGDLAEKWSKIQRWEQYGKCVHIRHPSALLQMDIARRPLEEQRVTVRLRDVFMELALE